MFLDFTCSKCRRRFGSAVEESRPIITCSHCGHSFDGTDTFSALLQLRELVEAKEKERESCECCLQRVGFENLATFRNEAGYEQLMCERCILAHTLEATDGQ